MRRNNISKGNSPCYYGSYPGKQLRGTVICPCASGCCDENSEQSCGFKLWRGPLYDNKFGFAIGECCEASTYGTLYGEKMDPGGSISYKLPRQPEVLRPLVYCNLGIMGLCWIITGFNCCTALPCSEQDVTALYEKKYPADVIRPPVHCLTCGMDGDHTTNECPTRLNNLDAPKAENMSRYKNNNITNPDQVKVFGSYQHTVAVGMNQTTTTNNNNAKRNSAKDKKNALKEYKSMLDDGLISNDDYEKKKKEILFG